MNAFYQQFLTDKSFILLVKLNKRSKFVLIGGWAVYFYSHSLKSKDIDMIVDYSELFKIKKEFPLYKNDRLKKYEIKIEEIDIDIYVPFYSDLGLPVQDIIRKANPVKGFILPDKEILLITKLYAYMDRKESVKGQKDFIDIVSLIILPDFNFDYLSELLNKYRHEKYKTVLVKIISETREIEELGLNRHAWAKKKKEILKKIS